MLPLKWKQYQKIEDFYHENIAILLQEEAVNNLMIGNINEVLSVKNIENWILAQIENDEKQVEAIFLYRPPYKLLCYCPVFQTNKEFYDYAAKCLYRINQNLIGVNTDIRVGNLLADSYVALSHQKKQTEVKMRILVVHNLENIPLKQALFRKAQIKDRQTIIENMINFHKEVSGEIRNRESCEREFDNCMKTGIYVLEKEGKIVSQAFLKRKLIYGKNISGVYTPKEERGKGYAKTCVYLLSKKCLEEGARYCVLYADDSNPISNHVYEEIGYKRISDQEAIDFFVMKM